MQQRDTVINIPVSLRGKLMAQIENLPILSLSHKYTIYTYLSKVIKTTFSVILLNEQNDRENVSSL